MVAQRKYPDELRERAVKMVIEIRERDGKGHGELARVGRQLGLASPGRAITDGVTGGHTALSGPQNPGA
jgi:hypothetical protein